MSSWGRNFRWTLVGEIVGKGATFLFGIIVAREIGPQAFGIFSYALAIAAYAWIVADMGLSFYGTREVARGEKTLHLVVSRLLSLRIVTGTIAVLTGVFGALIFYDGANINAYMIALLQVLFLAITADWVLRGGQQFKSLAGANIVAGAFLVSGALLIASVKATSAQGLLYFLGLWASFQAVMAITTMVLVINKTKMALRFDLSHSLRHIRLSVFFAASTGLVTASQYLPILVLNNWVGNEAAGLFSAPYRLILTAITAIYMLTSSSFPILAESYSKAPDVFSQQFRKTRNIVLSVASICGAAVYVMSEQIVRLLWGGAYLDSAPIMALITILIPIVSIRAVYGTALLAMNLERIHLMGAASGFILWICLGLPLVKIHGVAGAVWACIGSEALIAATMVWMTKRAQHVNASF